MTLSNEIDLLCAWGTPIYTNKYVDSTHLNTELEQVILKTKNTSKEYIKDSTNIGMWRTNSDLLKWDDPCIKVFSRWITESIFDYIDQLTTTSSECINNVTIEAWANIYSKGHYQLSHVHHFSNLSAVYFVADHDNPTGSGALQFYDPRCIQPGEKLSQTDLGSTLSFQAESGLLVVFPSWLEHFVSPYYGERRISIAFNMKIQ